MTFRVPLPAGGSRSELDIIDPYSSMVQRFLRREGLQAYERETATTLLTLFEMQEPGFSFFDVGANVGLYAHLCASMFDGSRVQAFEPTPDIAAIARGISAANKLGIEVIEAAVSDSAGSAALYLSETSDASNSLTAGFKQATGAVEVRTIRLDDHVEATGVGPDVLKVDVETHEPAALRGARDTICTHRPYIVIEVLRRRGSDQGPLIEAELGAEGYHFYRLSKTPNWTSQSTITGSGTVERDWLLAPEPLPPDFGARWDMWNERLGQCSPDRNPRPPIGGAARAAYRRGGAAELMRSARRFVRSSWCKGVRHNVQVVGSAVRNTFDRFRRRSG